MREERMSTRALLACGVVAGPIYVVVTLIQALTREGFDMKQHRFTLLTAGDLGWIHQLNMVLVGASTLLLAIGVRRALRTGRGALWIPRLLALFGLAYVVGGLLTSDPVAGFPMGTTPDLVETTLEGKIQNASRGVSTLLLLATSGVLAGRLASQGRRGWAVFFGAGIPVVFLVLAAVGRVLGTNPAAPAFLMTPWVWVTALAFYLYRLEARRRQTPSSEIVASATRSSAAGSGAR
jgi:hypothetical protein